MKGFFNSKVNWVGILMVVFYAIKQFTGYEVDSNIATQIVNQDWSNLGGALVGVLIIVLRTYFTTTAISGLFGKK